MENKNNECGRMTDGARHQLSVSEKNGGGRHLVPVLLGSRHSPPPTACHPRQPTTSLLDAGGEDRVMEKARYRAYRCDDDEGLVGTYVQAIPCLRHRIP